MIGLPDGAPASVSRPAIVAITSGKGGVGKTSLTANLAVCLARLGTRAAVLDADLGLANLDVLLGVAPERTIEHFIRGECSLLDVTERGPEGVLVVPAGSGLPELTALDETLLARFAAGLEELSDHADVLLIDSAAGIGEQTCRITGMADRVLVVTWPEPTALVDAYATIKVLAGRDPERPLGLVVNGCRDEAEADRVHLRLRAACRRFLDRDIELIGSLTLDDAVPSATIAQTPFVLASPHSRASRDLERLALRLSATCGELRCAPMERACPGAELTSDVQH
jgi:flagellar biosynthesis protein FlhG